MNKKKIAIIVGARPNFVKVAGLVDELEKQKSFDYLLVHTGQHYDFLMSKVFFEDLDIPKPHINLEIRSDKYPFTTQIAVMKEKLQEVFQKEKPDIVLVFGDCNSAIGGALAAKSSGIKIGHVEAGLRSFDRTMSEESNRLITDLLSDYLFTHSEDANQNLLNEGHNQEKIFFVGNTMIDALVKSREVIAKRQIINSLGLQKGEYAVLTLHRYNNIDVKPVLKEIFEAIFEIQRALPIIFPVHPSTLKKVKDFFPNFEERASIARNLRTISPLGYLDMISLLENAKLAMTDSGGVQEETTYLGVPCLTLRNNTERPITITLGTNVIAGTDFDSIISSFEKMMELPKSGSIPPMWDGQAGKRILELLCEKS